jgi:hypothetical protein
MGVMLKKVLALFAGTWLLANFAAAAELRPDHPDSYTVRRGDTLWDISARFLKSPWLWPEIWQANPQIENPHLIFPGDVISLVYIDGKPHLVVDGPTGEEKLSPQVRRDALDDAVPPVPLADIRAFLDRPRILSEEEAASAPYVVGLEDNRLIGSRGELGYVRDLTESARLGDRFLVARPTLTYTDMPKDNRKGATISGTKVHEWQRDKSLPLRPSSHWALLDWAFDGDAEVLGIEVLVIGTATVSQLGDPAIVYLTYNDIEIKAGDLLLPYSDSEFDLSYLPRPAASVPENMAVIAFTGPLHAVGPRQVVVLNRGGRDGVENGQVYAIYQPGEVVKDTVAFRPGSFSRKADVTLPEEYVGHLMVFRTFDAVSYGLVMDAVKPTILGAQLRTPVE